MSNQTSLVELQPAIFVKLTGDTQLMAIITGVFDYGAVPVNQSFPYITLGDDTEAPMNAFGTRGYEATVTLHIWDNTPNFKRCKTILAHMNRLLDQQALTLATQHHVGTWYDFSTTMNDPGLDNIRHMPVRYRFETQEVEITIVASLVANAYLPYGWDTAWQAAKSNVANQRVNVVAIGDSITSGQGSSDIMINSWWAKLRAAMLLANSNKFGGDHYGLLYSSALGLSTAIPPIVVNAGGAWTQYYGGFQQCVANGTTAYTPFVRCTPPYNVTGFDILYIDFGGGSWTYNIDGGSNTTVNVTGPFSFDGTIVKKISVTGLTKAPHTLNINSTTVAATCIIIGITAYSDTTGLCFANMGLNGMGLVTGLIAHNSLADTTLFPPDKLALYQGYQGTTAAPSALSGLGFPSQPDLAIIAFGVNDATENVSRANFRDTLDRLVWSLRYGKNDACSIIIVAMYVNDGTAASATTVTNTDFIGSPTTAYRDIKAAMLEVAQANKCAFIDVHGAFGRFPVTNGWVTSTTDIHPTVTGHAKIADLLSALL